MSSRVMSVGEFKALVQQLVKAVGGVEAAGVILGISHQRVSQLQSVNSNDMMGVLQVQALEASIERSIVLEAAARASDGRDGDADISAAVVACVTAAAEALQADAEIRADGRVDQHEVVRFRGIIQKLAGAVTNLVSAGSRMTPGAGRS